MKVVCLKCGLIQEKSSNCRNESCYHPFSKGGWSLQIDKELKDSLGINEAVNNTAKINSSDIKCINCGNEEKLDSNFCSKCGYEIPDNAILYQKFCSVCLTNYDDEVNFCNKDGTALSKKKVEN